MTNLDTFKTLKLIKSKNQNVSSKTKQKQTKISGIEIRLTFDIFKNIDPN